VKSKTAKSDLKYKIALFPNAVRQEVKEQASVSRQEANRAT